jgi:hypothetical protein
MNMKKARLNNSLECKTNRQKLKPFKQYINSKLIHVKLNLNGDRPNPQQMERNITGQMGHECWEDSNGASEGGKL